MTQTLLFSRTMSSFSKSSKSFAGSLHHSCRRTLSFFHFHRCARLRKRRENIPKEKEHGGRNMKSLRELMKFQEDNGGEEIKDCGEERRLPGRVRAVKLKEKEKEKEKESGGGARMMEEMKEMKEREMRVKASYEALGRLIEVEVMEGSDLAQVLDLKEVFFNYPSIQNHLLVDLLNSFIMDVSRTILPQN